MDKFDILKLRDLPIEGVTERLGLRVQHHKALCPFHPDSHPSLSFRVSTNTFKCFVCGAHGGVIDLAMHVLGKPFVETCRWLADEHNVILSEWQPVHKPSTIHHKPDVRYLCGLVAHPILNAEARKFLFDQRHYNPRVVEWLGISSISQPTPCWRYGRPFYDAPSLLFPYRDVDGNVLNVQSRYLGPPPKGGEQGKRMLITSDRSEGSHNSYGDGGSKTGGVPPRFRFPSNSSIHIFNLPILRYLKEGEPLYISEGITDCIALLSAGYKAIAIPSATLLNKDDLEILKRYKAYNLHVFPDQDQAGRNLLQALLSAATQIGASLLRHDLPPGCKDFSDYWVSINHKL